MLQIENILIVKPELDLSFQFNGEAKIKRQ